MSLDRLFGHSVDRSSARMLDCSFDQSLAWDCVTGGYLPLNTAKKIITVLLQLAIIAVTVILDVILIVNSAIQTVTVIQSCLGRPW